MGNLHRHTFGSPVGDPAALKQPVCIVDADEAFRIELCTHFAAHGLHAEGYGDAAALFKRLRQGRPGCIIVDMALPDMHGLAVQRILATQFSCIPLLFVAAEAPVPTVTQAMRMGACDFLVKPLDLPALLEQTRGMLDAVHRIDPAERRKETMRRRLRTLTAREHHTLTLALTGRSNKEISLELGISHRTVETHRAHVLQKIGVANLLELAHIFSDLPRYSADAYRTASAPEDRKQMVGAAQISRRA